MDRWNGEAQRVSINRQQWYGSHRAVACAAIFSILGTGVGGSLIASESTARVDRLRGLPVMDTPAQSADFVDYRVAATTRTGTMERELNHYARDGFFLTSVMGGETEFGGNELVAIVERRSGEQSPPSYDYIVLATSRTGTMDKEMRDAARRGFVFAGLTVYESAFGGDEVVIVMERNLDYLDAFCEYELLATNRTSTMEDELVDYSDKGFRVLDMAVSRTTFGGQELVVVTERCSAAQ